MASRRAIAASTSITENWGFAGLETDSHKLVIDEDTLTPVQLFNRSNDQLEDHNLVADPEQAGTIEALLDEHVRPFWRLHPPDHTARCSLMRAWPSRHQLRAVECRLATSEQPHNRGHH